MKDLSQQYIHDLANSLEFDFDDAFCDLYKEEIAFFASKMEAFPNDVVSSVEPMFWPYDVSLNVNEINDLSSALNDKSGIQENTLQEISAVFKK